MERIADACEYLAREIVVDRAEFLSEHREGAAALWDGLLAHRFARVDRNGHLTLTDAGRRFVADHRPVTA